MSINMSGYMYVYLWVHTYIYICTHMYTLYILNYSYIANTFLIHKIYLLISKLYKLKLRIIIHITYLYHHILISFSVTDYNVIVINKHLK